MLALHASDLQTGRPYLADRAEALVALARETAPDVVVLAGDLTQRAKRAEYRTVRSILDALEGIPTVVTPGNHDVPLYRVWERLLAPYRNWRRFVSRDLDTTLALPKGVIVALNSSAPRTAIVGGRLRPRQVALAADAFGRAPAGAARILVVHHHFVPTPDGLGGRPLPGARRLLEAFEAMRVEVILGGHVHQTHVTTSRALVPGPGPGIPLVACGTTASSRGRGPEAGRNSLNLVRVGPDAVEVVSHAYDPEGARFVPGTATTLPHANRGRAPSVEPSTR